MSSNQRKAETLGVAHGTAQNILRRNIIFELLTGTRWMDWGVCYKCKDAIMSPEELSIEHKLPWEGRENGKSLYWDLDNIDFSHKRCNRPHIAVLVPKPLKHSRYGYEHGCRCTSCKEAKQIHNRERYSQGNCRSSTKEV